jgi:hypothetical protein
MGISILPLDRFLPAGPEESRHRAAPPETTPVPDEAVAEGQGASPLGNEGPVLDLRGTRVSLLEASLQLHLERTVLDRTGRAMGVEVLDLQVKIQRIRFESITGGADEAPEDGGVSGGLQRLLEYFGVEQTAQRVSNFVRSGFGRTSFGSEDTAGSRGTFVDFILPFIREGVDSALALFGDSLPDEIRAQAEGTFARVKKLLEEFVRGGEVSDGAEAVS